MKITKRIQFSGKDLDLPFVQQIGFDHFTKPIPLEEHQHSGFELTYIDNGQVAWQLDADRTLSLKGHDIALTQPHTPHKGEFDIITPSSLFWISFDFSSKEKLKNTPFTWREFKEIETELQDAGNFSHNCSEHLRQQIFILCDVFQGTGLNDSPKLLARYIQSQICLIIMNLFNEVTSVSPRKTSGHVDGALEFINKNIHKNISVGDVAKATGISTGYLYEVFNNEEGVSPADFIQRLRCQKAKVLLKEGLTSTAISLKLGFNTSQYFATCFKKYTGMTPTQYRKREPKTRP